MEEIAICPACNIGISRKRFTLKADVIHLTLESQPEMK